LVICCLSLVEKEYIMRAQILSDLHIEFGKFDFDFSNIDLLVLAGDVHTGDKGFSWIADKVKTIPVLYVLGNHEYYRNSYPKLLFKLRDKSKGTNIHVLEKETIIIDGVSFHGLTLWTDFELFGNPEIAGYECQKRMNDYQMIRIDPSYSRLRSIDTHIMHYESLRWLEKSLENSKTKTNMVISHHAPSMKSISDEFRADILSSAFASNLEDFILKYQPDVWIHGHVHHSFDYWIGKTRVICNPKGYPDEAYNGYNPKLTIEISES
jgi:Icc-related predicted phosphoesterase